MKRQATTAVVVAILLFALGVFTGAMGHHLYQSRSAHGRGPDDPRQHYMSELRSKLNLTPEQVQKLEQIMEQTHARFKAVHDADRPIVAKIKEEHTAAIRSILTPAQLPLYDHVIQQHEKHARETEQHDR